MLAASWFGAMLFMMVLAAGVYLRYPDAAPVAVTAPDWRRGFSGAGLAGPLQFIWAGFAVIVAPLAFIAIVLV